MRVAQAPMVVIRPKVPIKKHTFTLNSNNSLQEIFTKVLEPVDLTPMVGPTTVH